MDSVQIKGMTFNVGDRIHIHGKAPFKSDIYALISIHPKGNYVAFRRSPRPGLIRRDGFGVELDFFDDKVVWRVQKRGILWLSMTQARAKMTVG